jgi:hypothetical protein
MSESTLLKIRKSSPSEILIYLLNRFFNTYLMKFFYMSLVINMNEIYKKLDTNLKVEELNLDSFLLGDKLVFNEKKMGIIEDRLKDPSYKAYGIVENDVLLYSTWISYKKLGLPVQSKYYLEADEALLEDSYCHPNARGKGLHTKMNLYRIAKIYEAGKTKVVAIVLDNNVAALKVQVKSGFRNMGVFYAGKILGFSFSTLNKIKK